MTLHYLLKHKNRSYFLMAISIFISFLIFGSNLGSYWWIIDDHFIVDLMGVDGEITFLEMFDALAQTELFKFGEHFRYRTSYWPLKILEIYLFGDNPSMHFLLRIMIFASLLFTFLFFSTLKKEFFLQGFFISLLIIPFQYYDDIFSRLSTGECYAVLGMVMYIWGHFIGVTKSFFEVTWVRSIGCLLFFVGGLIMIGAKEAYIVILMPSLYVIIKQKIQGMFSFGYFISFLMMAMNSLMIIAAICIYFLNKREPHEYDNFGPSLLPDIISSSLSILQEYFFLFPLLSLFLILSVLWRLCPQHRFIFKKSIINLFIVYSLISVLVFVMNIFFKGNMFAAPRYQFPVFIFIPVVVFVISYEIDKIAKYFGVRKILRQASFLAMFGSYLIFSSAMENMNYLQKSAAQKNIRTNNFKYFVEEVSSFAHQHPSDQIIFESYDVWDYELLTSVYQFLRSRNIKNKIYLHLNFEVNDIPPSPVKTLAMRLKSYSENGGGNKWGFAPYSQLDIENGRCISIDFKKKSSNPCRKYSVPFPG